MTELVKEDNKQTSDSISRSRSLGAMHLSVLLLCFPLGEINPEYINLRIGIISFLFFLTLWFLFWPREIIKKIGIYKTLLEIGTGMALATIAIAPLVIVKVLFYSSGTVTYSLIPLGFLFGLTILEMHPLFTKGEVLKNGFVDLVLRIGPKKAID